MSFEAPSPHVLRLKPAAIDSNSHKSFECNSSDVRQILLCIFAGVVCWMPDSSMYTHRRQGETGRGIQLQKEARVLVTVVLLSLVQFLIHSKKGEKLRIIDSRNINVHALVSCNEI